MPAVVTTSVVCLQAPSATERPISAPARQRARLGSASCFDFILGVIRPASVRNKAVGAAIIPSLLDTARNAVDAIDAAEQVGLRIRGAGKAVIGPRQVLLRYRAHHIG